MRRLVALYLWLFSRLPLRLNHAVGATLGWLAWVLPTPLKRRSLVHLARAFPDRDPAWHRRIARASLLETGKAFSEAPLLWQADSAQLSRWLHGIEGSEVISAAIAQGRGVCFAVPHLGSWEFAGLYGTVFGPLTTVYRPPRQAFLESVLRQARERTGARLVPANRSGIKALKQALQRKEHIGILPDQAPKGNSGILAPFFGQPARTMLLVSRLTHAERIPVVFAFAQRLPQGQGFRYHFVSAPDTLYSTDPVEAVTALNQRLEELIRRHPEQYLWSYRRWPRQHSA